ncbi:MAG: aspartate carbamoyltransferase catalytic subunit [Planctomycetota bacterium]|jgi:aspartate carbamoyltransferase catalytic subunit
MPDAVNDQRSLLALDGVSRDEILALLDEAERFRAAAAGEAPPLSVCAGRLVANLFFEDSTRTRCCFTVAAKRLGAETVDLTGIGSSLSKGETLIDTALTVEAMGVSALVVRSPHAGTPRRIASFVACPVINAGDGRHEHPTQALLDILTLRGRWGDLTGHTVAIVGDIANSRVARSNIHGLTTLGADVLLIGPPTLVPRSLERIAAGPGRVTVGHDLDTVLPEVDAIMMLRVQVERHTGRAVGDDYRAGFGLTEERATRLRPDVPVMHPGPMNRGVEIDSRVADDPKRSVILKQVANGVPVRMAVLARCL